ncbi:helix-turn-helix transcriptional regulator [Tichowtungia aerotolerans]|uniref:Helix-turn-helix domain-containing protein n=1 Tax=Tichowtungia aerotolerans TaxID=2697043 RepID=A0A6P1M2P7_9BACT|nr:AraC family transcriptional regulator [Tichowtungia aerotolerans]QHI69109.1 helix-turn-helix domain-containing protein [Tichowtungia aerotolerans]
MDSYLRQLQEPEDYFRGLGESTLPNPRNILLFLRPDKKRLQQEAPQNRSHHRFVLIFNLQTAGHVHVNHLSLPLAPQQALLIHPYQFHHFSQLASSKVQWLICTFELENSAPLEPLRNRVIQVSRRSEKARDQLLHEWLRCFQPESHSELQEALLQTALVRQLLCLRQDRQAAELKPQTESKGSLIRTVNRHLTEWRGRLVTVADLADAIGLSESRLRVRFKEAAGISLGSYIQNYRINRAMELLRTTPRSIADVAEEAGFGSPQAFCRTFKKETGQTPRSYRAG